MSDNSIKQKEQHEHNSNLPQLDRRRIVGRLAKVSIVVPVATLLFDASNNTAQGY